MHSPTKSPRLPYPSRPYRPPSALTVSPAWMRLDLVLAFCILLIGLLTRLHGLGNKPYWLDEVTTLRRASLGPADMIVDSLSFHHLPLYFLISHWFLGLGTDEASLRLPAALFGALSCALLFGLSRMIGGRRAAIAASLLLALDPFQVQYGQEARSYTLVISFILLALWALAFVLRSPQAASRRLLAPGGARVGWLLYAVATIGALDTLSVAVFWLLAGLLSIAVIAARTPDCRRGLLVNAAIVHAVILACYLPWIVAIYHLTHGKMASGLDWVPPLNWHSVWTTIQAVYLLRTTSLIRFHTFPDGLPWLGALTVLAAATGLLATVRRDRAALVAAIALLTLPAGLLITSIFSPVWMPRYLAWSGPIFFLFAGLGVARLPRRASWLAIAFLCGAGIMNLLPYYRLETKPLWDEAALLLRGDLSPGAMLFTDSGASIGMMNVRLQRLGRPFQPYHWTTNIGTAMRHLQAGYPLWAVHGRVGQADHNSVRSFNLLVEHFGAPCWTGNVGLDIIVEAFGPPGGPCPQGATP